MKFNLGRETLEIIPENAQDELWLENFIEKRRSMDGFEVVKDSLEIQTKDNNEMRELSADIPSSNVRKALFHAGKKNK